MLNDYAYSDPHPVCRGTQLFAKYDTPQPKRDGRIAQPFRLLAPS